VVGVVIGSLLCLAVGVLLGCCVADGKNGKRTQSEPTTAGSSSVVRADTASEPSRSAAASVNASRAARHADVEMTAV
jgi:hypothetical protein